MKDIVIHVCESVCAAHNRDPEAKTLIEVAQSFGSVESLESALSNAKAQWQAEMNKLMAQHNAEVAELRNALNAIAENKVTAPELKILRLIREKSALEAAAFEKDIQARDDLLRATRSDYEAKAAQIRALLGT
jgi:F0F1-type ATP synthase delta subunit